MEETDVLVVGGGLAGWITTLELLSAGFEVYLIEKKNYPFHKVCGEYVSRETLPLLQRLGLDPFALGAQSLRRLRFTSPQGQTAELPLPKGAFSLSRYVLDEALYKLAKNQGAKVRLNSRVQEIRWQGEKHEVELSDGTQIRSKVVIGAYGKRSHLDRLAQRPFFRQRSPFVGIKYHAKMAFPDDLVSLHNFKAGYCGISRVEGEDKVNICYLTTRDQLRRYKDFSRLTEQVLFANPALKADLQKAVSLFESPLVINEISFAPKELVADHVLMTGDAAGMIMPLSGNGMAMAMHGAFLLAGWVNLFLKGTIDRKQMERGYERDWKARFQLRLWTGRQLQRIFRTTFWSESAVSFLRYWPGLGKSVIKKTHGQDFGYQPYVAKP
jgi:flavin-dependent dehydrogenase